MPELSWTMELKFGKSLSMPQGPTIYVKEVPQEFDKRIESKSPMASRPGSRAQDLPINKGNKILFDSCTIRQWFLEMDIEKTGHVEPREFMNFLRERPQLKNLMLEHARAEMKGAQQCTDREFEALEMRRLKKFLKEMDEDGNGTLEWEEFVEFFRRTGYLLEYAHKDNPREKISELLNKINDQQEEEGEADEDLVDEFQELTKKHMGLNCRRKSRELVSTPVDESFDWDLPKALNTGRRASGSSIPSMTEAMLQRSNSKGMGRRMSAPMPQLRRMSTGGVPASKFNSQSSIQSAATSILQKQATMA